MGAAERKARLVALLRGVLAEVDAATRAVPTTVAGYEVREVATWEAVLRLVEDGKLHEFGVHQRSDLDRMVVTVENLPRGVHVQIHLHGTPLEAVLNLGAAAAEPDDEITDVQSPRAKALRSEP